MNNNPNAALPATAYTSGQRVVMVWPLICAGQSGVISDVSGDGKTLHVKFAGQVYNSLVGSEQVRLLPEYPSERKD